MANGLVRQCGYINCRTIAAQGPCEITADQSVHCHLPCVLLRGFDTRSQLMHQPAGMRGRRAQTRILKVNVQPVRPKSDGKGLRQHPEHAHTTHQVAVFKCAREIRGEIVT